jgi:hypothetical protein
VHLHNVCEIFAPVFLRNLYIVGGFNDFFKLLFFWNFIRNSVNFGINDQWLAFPAQNGF